MYLKDKTDEELVFLSIEDNENFGELIDRYEKKLLNYIGRISNFNIDEKKDILQDVFLKVYKNLNSFEKGEKFSSWIYKITYNTTIDTWKKYKKDKEQDISVDDNLHFVESIFWKNDVQDEIFQNADRELLDELFNQLDLKYRAVFILRYFEARSYEEISDILEIPKATVATYLHRGLKKLKKIYKEKYNK